MAPDAFLSYCTEDGRDVAFALCNAIEAAGLRCWIAPRDIAPGSIYPEAIVAAIEAAPVLVLVLTERANESPHVRSEVERAFSKRKTIIPVRATRGVVPGRAFELFLGTSQWVEGAEGAIAEAAAALVAVLRPGPLAILAAPTDRAAPSDLPPAICVGPWVLGRLVYESANWRCWDARHARAGTIVRFAHLLPQGWLGREGAALVTESAERSSAVEHAGLVAVLDWGEHEGMPFVVTGPVGRSLREQVDDEGPLDEAPALEVFTGLAEAVAHLHARGLVYQSVNPSSVHVRPGSGSFQLGWPMMCVPIATPFVDDRRIVRLAGVPLYMPPESFWSEGEVRPAADLFGLGEVLFYALAGSAAFGDVEGSSLADLARRKTDSPRRLRDLAPEVTQPTARLVSALLAPDPASRLASASEALATAGGILRRLRK